MASNKRTYTIRNKMSGEIVGYWDSMPNSDEATKAMLRREFGQGRFQITYTGRKKVVDEKTGKEKMVTHPVNQFFIVGNPQTGMATFQGQQYMPQHGGGEYREFILPFMTETRQAVSAMSSDIAAMSDTLAVIRADIEALMTEDESGTFDDVEEKSGFGIEKLAADPKYNWAIPLVMAGDNDGFINGLAAKIKEQPTFLHDLIRDIVGAEGG